MHLRTAWAITALLATGMGACTVPTESPAYDATWAIPTTSTSIALGEILPAGVTATETAISAQTTAASGQIAVALGGVGVVALPADLDESSVSAPNLPADFIAGTPAANTALTVSVVNGLSFDPLRPDGTRRGTLRVTVRAAGQIIGSATLSGTTVAFASGSTRQIVVPITASVVAAPITVETQLQIPAGSQIARPTSGAMTATAAAQSVSFTQVTARVVDQIVSANDVTVSTSDIDASVRQRVASGSLRMRFENPWNVAVAATVTLRSSNGTPRVTQEITVAPGGSVVDVPIAPTAMRALLAGPNIRVRVAGTGSGQGTNNSVVLMPGESLNVSTEMTLNVEVGS